ncbi:hypothetical protein [uncultured Tateyamaria sp.]|uniref:hypothetical protein n=1 Tax=uncultured Tateyamaria sp. TaxID=455651 RepID=UPI0026381E2E|nr:hypothetical protein [uncultured Tateyamaria sp.]
MYWPIPGIKNHAERRWNQPDRIFFGFGACHILAGVFLEDPPIGGFFGEWIVPDDGFTGTHMFVTNGEIAFDFHGYSARDRLLARYWRGHRSRYLGWGAKVVKIDFPLLHTAELNARKHLGPDQYFGDPIPRAQRFIAAKKCPADLQRSD